MALASLLRRRCEVIPNNRLVAFATLTRRRRPAAEAPAADEAAISAQLAATRLIADDPTDARRPMAAGDLGSAYALGVHGVEKDLTRAEAYLRIGADGGDAGSQRNLAMLLLESERASEAAEWLRRAADQGDADAAATLDSLVAEAAQKREAALFKLRALASAGDERARAMLEEMGNED